MRDQEEARRLRERERIKKAYNEKQKELVAHYREQKKRTDELLAIGPQQARGGFASFRGSGDDIERVEEMDPTDIGQKVIGDEKFDSR